MEDGTTVTAIVRPWKELGEPHEQPAHHFTVEAVQPLADPNADRKTSIVDLPRHGNEKYLVMEVGAYQRFLGMPPIAPVEIDIDAAFFSMPLDDPDRWEMLWSALVAANQKIRQRDAAS
jgi:hypothetical protein